MDVVGMEREAGPDVPASSPETLDALSAAIRDPKDANLMALAAEAFEDGYNGALVDIADLIEEQVPRVIGAATVAGLRLAAATRSPVLRLHR